MKADLVNLSLPLGLSDKRGPAKRRTPAMLLGPDWVSERIREALLVLGGPPPILRDDDGSLRTVVRFPGRGTLVCRFVLPLELCAPANRYRQRDGWAAKNDRNRIHAAVAMQIPRQSSPLPGRPMLRAVRFSSTEPDSTAVWWKEPVDRLLPARMRGGRLVPGLGLIRDDRPKSLETVTWWEPTKRGHGFCLFEVWTGGAP